jgi:hypothetical protein
MIVPPEMLAEGGLIAKERFRACELKLMVCGSPDIDIKDLQARAQYRGCQMGDKMCKWFFEVLAGWQAGKVMFDPTESQKEDWIKTPPFYYVNMVVEYATGSPRAPPGGYQVCPSFCDSTTVARSVF